MPRRSLCGAGRGTVARVKGGAGGNLHEEAGTAGILERGRRTEAASHELGSRDLQLVSQLVSCTLQDSFVLHRFLTSPRGRAYRVSQGALPVDLDQ